MVGVSAEMGTKTKQNAKKTKIRNEFTTLAFLTPYKIFSIRQPTPALNHLISLNIAYSELS